MTELTAQERAALALWLVQQQPMTTRQLADRLGLSMSGTWCMITNISRVVPIAYSYTDRSWYLDAPGCTDDRKELPTRHDN